MTPLTKDDLARGFRDLGVKPGMCLAVHSSLKSFGRTAEGPKTVIDALMDAVTEEGTLVFPSFNHGAPFEPGGAGCYSPLATACTNGAIPDHFWRRPGVLRSLDPTHAFAAWGKRAREFLKDHHRTITMGRESPLGRLWRAGGHCLLIGVGYGPVTFKHGVEMTTEAPCLGVRTEAYPVKLQDGRRVLGRTWGWRSEVCPINDRARFDETEMTRRGLHAKGNVGPSPCILFKLDDFYEIVSGYLRSGVAGHAPCSKCPVRPRRVAATVESDWDCGKGCLRPDSEAWTYEDGM